MQLLRNLRPHLGSVPINGLPPAENEALFLHADGINGRRDDLGGGIGVASAELAGGKQDALVHTHGNQFPQHPLRGRRAHGKRNNFASQFVLQGQCRLRR